MLQVRYIPSLQKSNVSEMYDCICSPLKVAGSGVEDFDTTFSTSLTTLPDSVKDSEWPFPWGDLSSSPGGEWSHPELLFLVCTAALLRLGSSVSLQWTITSFMILKLQREGKCCFWSVRVLSWRSAKGEKKWKMSCHFSPKREWRRTVLFWDEFDVFTDLVLEPCCCKAVFLRRGDDEDEYTQ